MKISRIEIRNFRSFRNFAVNLDGASMFIIGENAGGKTSLLTAIARALGRDLNFRIEDFADRQKAIEIEVTLTCLDQGQAALQPPVHALLSDWRYGWRPPIRIICEARASSRGRRAAPLCQA